MSTRLMLERAVRFNDSNTDEHDTEILNDCRRTVLDILEDAELTMWDLEDAGWQAPSDDSAIAHAARLLFCTARLNDLIDAVALTREITLDGWRAPKGWPTTPRRVTAHLRRQAPVMRKAGWTVEDDEGSNRDKVIRWTITSPPERPEMVGIQDPRHPQDPQSAGVAGLAGDEYGPSQDDNLTVPACIECKRPAPHRSAS